MCDATIIGLGLESSCDETAAAIIANGKSIKASVISSQIDLHRQYHGVVPEIASRAHLEIINELIKQVMETADIHYRDIHYVAATNRPGLIGSLLIALQSAKVISYLLKIPLIGINHLEAHLYAPFLENHAIEYPFIGLLVSGGNTALYQVNGIGQLDQVSRTTDDAVGEAFDKIAKYMDLGYPGGPAIELLANNAKETKHLFPKILTDSNDFRFSYSGLKTAVVNYIKENPQYDKSNVARSFQERALELLVRRTYAVARQRNIKTIVIAGGVAANSRLRQLFDVNKNDDEIVIIPSKILCTDNAAMVGGLGYWYYTNGINDHMGIDVHARV